MSRAPVVGAALLAAFALGAVANAAAPWRTFASASDNGDYSTYASADSKVVAPKALALRVAGPVESVSWNLSCEGETKTRRSGISVVAVNTADTCTLYVSASGDEGTLRLQLLRR